MSSVVPTQPSSRTTAPGADPASVQESYRLILAQVLADADSDRVVGPDDDFFADLGASSLTMTKFCARVRKDGGLPAVSVREVYAHPSIAALARSKAPVAPSGGPLPGAAGGLAPERPSPPAKPAPAAPPPVSRGQHLGCTALQGLVFVVYGWIVASAIVRGYAWVDAGSGPVQVYLRAVGGGAVAFAVVLLLPVLAKWVLIGRWTAREIPLWSTAYVRFWIVKSLLHASPAVLFAGSPLMVVYLRALGARIGPGATVLTRTLPVCTDLVSIGAGAVVRKDSVLLGYRIDRHALRTGTVSVGDAAYVGEKTVLDIGSSVGAGAQLGHTSSLQEGEHVPDGAHWHGCPAVPTDVDYQRVPAGDPTSRGERWRRLRHGTGTLLQVLLLVVPLGTVGFDLLLQAAPRPTGSAATGLQGLALEAVAVALALFVVLVPVMLLLVFVLPRVLGRAVRPDRDYPLYGWRYGVHRAVLTMTNRRLFTWLFGDSSFIVPYLRGLGYRMPDLEQTGSNFGTEVQHETPLEVTVGSGTMVADGLSILNADYSATSFRVSRVTLGARSFLGNNIAFPSGARVGDDCLLATKVMVPLDGPVREGVGLLGSPPFEIPRTVERDTAFDHLREGEELRTRLRAKNRYNLRSMALMLGARFVDLVLISAVAVWLLEVPHGAVDEVLLALYAPLTLAVTVGWFVLVERFLLRFGSLEPQLRSIYDPHFWRHERLWKVPDVYLNLLNGTALKPLVWRLLGVRIGRRVLDDGAYLTERTLTSIGDDAVLNHLCKLQAHSQEDGTFKSDRISIGAGATLAVGAFVHYGTSIGAGAVVESDSFLMKGEDVPAGARWLGNPATALEPAPSGGGRG